MRRMHLFEFEDQPWLPAWVRDALTEHLSQLFRSSKVAPLHEVMADRLAAVLERAGTAHLVDLCSGAGGPLPAVLPLLEARLGRAVTATLTDRYPHHDLAEVHVGDPERLGVEPRPVDARSIPPELDGVRTVFNAIHHFRPSEVAQVLRSATAGDRSVAIFEPFERRPRLAARLALGGFRDGWRKARQHRGPRWQAIALCLFLPVVLGWDGAASVIRGYQADELLAIAEGAAPAVAWRSERVTLPWGGMTLLIGEPGDARLSEGRRSSGTCPGPPV